MGAASGISPSSIGLMFAGRKLSAEKSLVEEGIQKECTFHVILNEGNN